MFLEIIFYSSTIIIVFKLHYISFRFAQFYNVFEMYIKPFYLLKIKARIIFSIHGVRSLVQAGH